MLIHFRNQFDFYMKFNLTRKDMTKYVISGDLKVDIGNVMQK